MTSISSSSTVPARTALAGNPSDGHGGAVVSTVVRSVTATVRATPTSSFAFPGSTRRQATIGEVAESVHQSGTTRDAHDGDHPLVQAALTALHDLFDADITPCDFTVDSSIPRSVGLAGSSAIVIATINASADIHLDAAWARHLAERPELIASVALHAERELLGIAAGLQDRVVQSLGGTVSMDFGPDAMRTVGRLPVGSYRRLTSELPTCFVACRPETAADSGGVHAAVDPTAPAVRAAMSRAAAASRRAAAAIEAGNALELGAAMDDTFDARASIMSLDPAHVEMVRIARGHGAAANYTGSGGAIVVLAPDAAARRALGRLGCTLLEL